MVRAAVLGGSGYIGGELLRLLLGHPKVEVSAVGSSRMGGEYLFRAHPNLRGVTDLKFVGGPVSEVTRGADVVFTALPHGKSVEVVPEIVKSGASVVDLSADFRLRNPASYEKWYGYVHPRPDLLGKFVLSVPELNREEVRGARLVASPGCMAITAILGMAPLFRRGGFGVDSKKVVVDAKVGSSGAGGKPSIATHFSERFGVVRPYKPTGHRHSAEISQVLSGISGSDVSISMSAHAVNMVRGILCTSHLFAENKTEVKEIWRAYRQTYSGSYFVRFVRESKGMFRYPDPKFVVGSNFCDVGFDYDEDTGRVVALSASDNLVKGAAGNAVQSMNLMLGYDETEGLRVAPLHPV